MTIEKNSIHFLKNLEKNNSKEWFESNRKDYEFTKNNFLELTKSVLAEVSKYDKTIEHLQPKECVFRINRDVRFSKNKNPYKNNMGMSIAMGGKKGNFAGYYFHLQPNHQSFIGGGLYMPMGDDLKKVRQEIDYNWADFNKIIHSKSFINTFGKLSDEKEMKLTRPPKGYDENNVAIEYLKHKGWVAFAKISDDELLQPNFEKIIALTFKELKPLIDFLNIALV